MKESKILSDIVKELYNHYTADALVLRINSGSFKVGNRYIKSVSVNGYPDITFIYRNSIFIGIEVKTDIGKLNNNQIEFQQKCKERNIQYIVVRNVQECIDKIERIIHPKVGDILNE